MQIMSTVWELIKLANRHPRVNILSPGAGVGGHCIAVDPWFIIHEGKEAAKILRAAREIYDYKSLWVVEKIKSTNYHPTLKENLFDFNLGYWVAAFLSICFVTMGAFLIFGTGNILPKDSVGFASSVIDLYTSTIGDWSYLIIAIAAFSIMLGTSIGVFDGYSRVLQHSSKILFLSNDNKHSKRIYIISLIILAIGSFLITAFFMGEFKNLIDLATTISFLIAPLVAIANLKLVSKKYIDKAYAPKPFMKFISYLGIVFLTGFALFYVYIKFIK